MKNPTNKNEGLNLQDSNQVVRFLNKLGKTESTNTLELTRGRVRAINFDASSNQTVDLDATKHITGRDIFNVVRSRIYQGFIYRTRSGKIFRVFQSNSSIPPNPSVSI